MEKTRGEKREGVIVKNSGQTEETIKHTIDESDKKSADKMAKAIGDVYRNKFCTNLEYEILKKVFPHKVILHV